MTAWSRPPSPAYYYTAAPLIKYVCIFWLGTAGGERRRMLIRETDRQIDKRECERERERGRGEDDARCQPLGE